MKQALYILLGLLAGIGGGYYLRDSSSNKAEGPTTSSTTAPEVNTTQNDSAMKLGAFSMSLSVKDLKASKEFYEKLGFTSFGGAMPQNYLIMKNGNALIGLFQGMFQGNIITFNPGWDEDAKNMHDFDDVREIQKQLKSHGVSLISEADESTTGPASLMVKDPDGNLILLDQHR